MTAIALPRVRQRRRKRRPMTPFERTMFKLLIADGFVMAAEVFVVAFNFEHPSLATPAVIAVALIAFAGLWLSATRLVWPVIRNYLRNGWEDE